MQAAFESLFIEYKVNVVYSGHVHAYGKSERRREEGRAREVFFRAQTYEYPPPFRPSQERSCPVNKGICQNDGEGIVHVTSGDGGASLYTKWKSPQPAWSLVRRAEFGHSELTFVNATHAHHTWHRNVDGESTVTDDTWLVNWA
jgi:hypothetical protein